MSPLIGLFVLMELITAGYIVDFWIQWFRHGIPRWQHGEFGAAVTALFLISNFLLCRRSRWAAFGFVLCWLALALALLPTV